MPPLHLISSMATRALLAQLCAAYERRSGRTVALQSVGGVDAAKRVAAGEAFDVVALAADAIDALLAAGHLVGGSRVELVRSSLALALPAGAAVPALPTEAALRDWLLAAPRIGLSTGPSGSALIELFARWGVADQLAPRTVVAPPGVPVGRLVADGRVELGFQQRSELMHLPGLTVVAALPVQITTVFAAAVGVRAGDREAAHALLAYLASPETAAVKQAHGMESA